MKRLLLLSIIFALTLSLTACARSGNSDNPTPSEPAPPKDVISETTGIYIGQIDNSSIEVQVNGTETAFRFSDALRESFGSLNLQEGQLVKLKYFENSNQQFIVEELSPVGAQAEKPN